MGSVLSSVWGSSTSGGNEEGASPRPAAVMLNPYPIPTGSLIYMQKQDPSITSIGHRPVWVPLDIQPGPQSELITIKGISGDVRPSDNDNNYLYNPEIQSLEFDCVNTFGIVNHVLTMYQRGLYKMGSEMKLEWQWGSNPPIGVYPRAGEWENAFYDRDQKILAFFYFTVNGETIYTGKSFDVVAHETGHAILDSLKPLYIISRNPQTGALHESFGDLTAIFALLYQLDMCEAIIALSKGDLHSNNFFCVIAEQFGEGLGLQMGLRNADHNFAIDEVTEEVHMLSVVFTGAVYDIIVELFEVSRDLSKYNPAESLFKVGKHMNAVTILGFVNAPDASADFSDVANSMIKAETNDQLKAIMYKHFEKRKIFDPTAKPRPFVEASGSQTICGTMLSRERKAEALAMISGANGEAVTNPT